MAKKKRRTSVWQANFTSGHCGLLPTDPINKGDDCIYLTCSGDDAIPNRQMVEIGENSFVDDHGVQYREVPTGRFRCKRKACSAEYDFYINRGWCHECPPERPGGKNRRAKIVPIYQWQENRGTPEDPKWHNVKVWDKAVKVSNARKLGFQIPGSVTVAAPGTRTRGIYHEVEATPESPLMDLARAGLTDEELGIEPGS